MDAEKIMTLEKEHIMQTYSRQSIVLERGNGCYVFDKGGKKYIDLVGGLATCILGHGNRQFAEAVKKQIEKITNPTNLYYTEEQVKLAEKLAGLSGLDKCFFSNSGAESIEAAIKLARKHTKKTGIIATKEGFHGRTFGSLSATGKEKIKSPFMPLLPGFEHVEYGNPDAINNTITKDTAAIIVEPIQGEAGIVMPCKDYLKHVREACNMHGALMILDEIQTGCGRTGKFFAYEHDKIKPDIVTLAKGLANGIPIGATIAKDEIAKSFGKGDHGSTFGGNPVACCAANFTVDYILKKRLVKNAAIQGKYFMKKLASVKSGPKEIRGKGLMIGMEMEKDAGKIQKGCMDKRLLVNLTAEKVIRFLPPLTISRKIIDDSLGILREVAENEN
ncbi:aspartate aminotransferase family protein [Candidatus Woesearchaeota archaeon]|nr:aspartate aminotransferase family protein [Candidatus Woesearchaeota archaeon]